MPSLKMNSSTLRLSECARHVCTPEGIVTTGWPAVRDRLGLFGIPFDLWQQGGSQLLLGKRADGMYAAGVGGAVISIPRQVGKTYWIGWLVFALCTLTGGLTVIWTAHHSRTSNETFMKMQAMARKAKVRPFIDRVRATNGEQSVLFKNGSRILFGAREQGFGLGFDSVDVLVLDEAQRVKEAAMNDMVPATNAAPNGLVIMMGTPPRPTDKGDVFGARRMDALGGDPDTLYIELSADPDAEIIDWDQVAKANPSFPHRTSKTAIMRMHKLLGSDDAFYREGYGIWDPVGSNRVIDEESWARQSDPTSMPVERYSLGIDVAPDRRTASVSLAGVRADGNWHVEVDEHKKGVDWVIPWVRARAEKNRLHTIVVDEVAALTEERNGRHYLTGTRIRVSLAAAEGRDMAIASGKFFDAVMDGSLFHTGQPHLDYALSVASKRPLAGGWAWNRKDPDSDISPVVACTLALSGAMNAKPGRPGDGSRSERRAVMPG